MFILSIRTSLFQVFTIVIPKVPLFKKLLDFSIHLFIPV